MSFVELTREEIELLSDEEKELYNRQLDLYLERINFIQKLSQVENADFNISKPVLDRIQPIQSVKVNLFQKLSKHTINIPNGIPTKKLKYAINKNNSEFKNNSSKNIHISNIPSVKIGAINRLDFKMKDIRRIQNVTETKNIAVVPMVDLKLNSKVEIDGVNKPITLSPKSILYSYKPQEIDVTPNRVIMPEKVKFDYHNAVVRDMPKLQKIHAKSNNYIYNNKLELVNVSKTIDGIKDKLKLSHKKSAIVCKTNAIEINTPKVIQAPRIVKYKKSQQNIKMSKMQKVTVPTNIEFKAEPLKIDTLDKVKAIIPKCNEFRSVDFASLKNISHEDIVIPACGYIKCKKIAVSGIPSFNISLPKKEENKFAMEKIIESIQEYSK